MGAAPLAPGRLGEALDPAAVQSYLADLQAWVRERRADLDELDQQALASPDGARLTGDLALALALWKAVADRAALIETTWDGGRVGQSERERLSVLIWGRLDQTLDGSRLAGSASSLSPTGVGAGSLAVSLPEACRLIDALIQQLRVALALDPAADANALRLKHIRAQIDRLRDQAGLEPSATAAAVRHQVDDLATRAEDLAARLSRGGDIGGLIGSLENAAARLERDLIVGGAQRRALVGLVAEVSTQRDALDARADAVRALADQAVSAVVPAPHQAVPDVGLLGPVPVGAAELEGYRHRLGRVERALDVAEQGYSEALARRAELSARLDAVVRRAQAAGVADDTDVAAAISQARDLLDRRPTPVPVADRLVDVVGAWVDVVTQR